MRGPNIVPKMISKMITMTMRIAIVFSLLLLASGCVLFEEVEYEDENALNTDYWAAGSCPGNTATDPTVVSNDCRGITLSGCCDISGNALYCFDGKLYCKSCAYNTAASDSAACSWSADENAYWCTATDNGADPSGAFPRACPALNTSK